MMLYANSLLVISGVITEEINTQGQGMTLLVDKDDISIIYD